MEVESNQVGCEELFTGNANGCGAMDCTPKRRLKFSPDTPQGLEGKLRRLTVEQTASPTLRDNVTSGQDVQISVHEPGSLGLIDVNLRKKVVGRRRLVEEQAPVVKINTFQNKKVHKIKGKSTGKRAGLTMRKKKSPSSKIPKGQRKIKEVLDLSNKKVFDPVPHTDDEDDSGVAK